MGKMYYLEQLIASKEFRYDRLVLNGIDNEPVKTKHGTTITDQETNLFHREVVSGSDYFDILNTFVYNGIRTRQPAPVVRFADGEYAFYAYSLHCNGLYQQAESVDAIKKAMPLHLEALRVLERSGKLAPLIFPGNTEQKKKTIFSFLNRVKNDHSAAAFLDFFFENQVALKRDNYVPFYVVYAYLTSRLFCESVDGKKLCIVSSECNLDLYHQWFARFSSYPQILFARLPDRYVATQWGTIKSEILGQIPGDTDLCLVGAGIGSLLVCVDIAQQFSIPAIDAGHVLNMMNGREDKSSGSRLYTIWKKQ